MKIYNDSLIQNQGQVRSKGTDRKTGADFAQTLSKAQGQADDGGTQTNQVSSVGDLLNINPVGGILAAAPGNPEIAVENTLDLLDQYSQALAGNSLDEAESVVSALEKEVENLTRIDRDLSSDHGLKSVVNETAVLATVETAKFRRGDYN